MADVLIEPVTLELNDSVLDPTVASATAYTVNSTDVGYLTRASSLTESIDNPVARGQVDLGKIVLRVTASAPTTLTVQAGENPPANRQIVGDLDLSLGTGTHSVILEAANYTWNDGTVRMVPAGTVTIAALELPHF